MNKKIKQIPQKFGKYYIPTIVIVMSILLFVIMFSSVRQKQVTFKVGQLAEETIRANKTIENKTETKEKQKLAMESVTPEYTFNRDIEKKQVSLVETIFSLVKEVNDEAANISKEAKSTNKDKDKDKTPVELTVEEKLPMLKSKFEKFNETDISFFQSFPDTFYEQLLGISNNNLDLMEKVALPKLQSVLSKHIRNSNLQMEKQSLKDSIQYDDLDPKEQQLVNMIFDRAIVVNEVANEKATEAMRESAKNNVLPVMIYQGEIIVREGEQIDTKSMEKIKLLGLTNQATSKSPMISMILAILLQLVIMYFILKRTDPTTHGRSVLLYAVFLLISILFMKFLYFFQKDSFSNVLFLFPAAFSPLVLYMFSDKRWGQLMTMFQAVFSIFIYYNLAGTTSLLVISLFYTFSAFLAMFLSKNRIGEQLKSAFFLLIVLPVLFMSILVIYQGFTIGDSKALTTIFIATGSGIFSFILSIGLYPYIELILSDESVIVLNELSNPNQPLLKQLLEEAPGTYHHSMMVASLSANAVAEIGGNSLLTRVASYYHDIGKIKHANFFVENLPEGAENPHNFLLPSDSKEIIFSHVTEGVKILEEADMPQFVIDVCKQHHGTTLMKYFFIKEQERNPDTDEEAFRYPGPKPQSREAGVINLADSAEAAVRAMDHPTNDKIKAFVHNLIQTRLEDGQLNQSGLTLDEIAIIEKSLINGLCSTFHSRIKYPKMKSEAEKMKQEQEGRRV